MRVGFLHSLIRKEEKLLLEELAKHGGVEVVMLDDRKMVFDLKSGPDVDVVLERCINHSRRCTDCGCSRIGESGA